MELSLTPRRIAVLLEPGRRGTTAVDRAAAISAEFGAELSVVALAPQAEPPRCGGVSPAAYNFAVLDEVNAELCAAARRLGGTDLRASFTLLLERRDPPLHRWLGDQSVDLVLLPARRSGRHPQARAVRRHTGAQVRVISR